VYTKYIAYTVLPFETVNSLTHWF